MLRSSSRTAEEEAAIPPCIIPKTCCPRQLCSGLEDWIESSSVSSLSEDGMTCSGHYGDTNRVVIEIPAIRVVRLVVRKLIYNAESPGKSDSPPKVLALEPINRRKSFFVPSKHFKVASIRKASEWERSRTIHFRKLLAPRRVCFYCTVWLRVEIDFRHLRQSNKALWLAGPGRKRFGSESDVGTSSGGWQSAFTSKRERVKSN